MPQGDPKRFLAWSERLGEPVVAAPGRTEDNNPPCLLGSFEVVTLDGPIPCTTVFQRYADLCRQYEPSRVFAICGIHPDQVATAAELLWHSRPVAFYAWSDVEQHTNATQTARAIGTLYALTGSLDSPGGNVLFPTVPAVDVSGIELISREQIRVPLEPRYRKFEIRGEGFATPTRRIEFYSETFVEHGYSPLPEYVPPLVRPEHPGLAGTPPAAASACYGAEGNPLPRTSIQRRFSRNDHHQQQKPLTTMKVHDSAKRMIVNRAHFV